MTLTETIEVLRTFADDYETAGEHALAVSIDSADAAALTRALAILAPLATLSEGQLRSVMLCLEEGAHDRRVEQRYMTPEGGSHALEAERGLRMLLTSLEAVRDV